VWLWLLGSGLAAAAAPVAGVEAAEVADSRAAAGLSWAAAPQGVVMYRFMDDDRREIKAAMEAASGVPAAMFVAVAAHASDHYFSVGPASGRSGWR